MIKKKVEKVDISEKKTNFDIPETPEELLAAAQELEVRVIEKEKGLQHEVTALQGAIKALKLEYQDDPEALSLISEAETLLLELDAPSDNMDFKGKESAQSYSPEEVEQQQAYLDKYLYSPDQFLSQSEYMEFLSNNLISLEEINLFLKYLYRYDLAYEQGKRQSFRNTNPSGNDTWKGPIEMVTEYNDEGRFSGDCEDIAILFEEILSKQNKEPFFFLIPGHALVSWVEGNEDSGYRAYVIDTTSGDGDLGEAVCRKLDGRPDQSKEEVFSELINSFSAESDSACEFDTDQMNLGFYINSNSTFDIPANFSLAQRYQELKTYLAEDNFIAVLDVINEEVEKDPESINLRISQLQFLLLTDAMPEEIEDSIDSIVSLYPANLNNKKVRDNLNQTAYFLAKQGYEVDAVSLLEPLVETYNEVFFEINLNDTLSDLYVGVNDFENAYQNDLQMLEGIMNFEEATVAEFGNVAPIQYFEKYGVMSMDGFKSMISARFTSNPKYKEYVSEKNIPDFFQEVYDQS